MYPFGCLCNIFQHRCQEVQLQRSEVHEPSGLNGQLCCSAINKCKLNRNTLYKVWGQVEALTDEPKIAPLLTIKKNIAIKNYTTALLGACRVLHTSSCVPQERKNFKKENQKLVLTVIPPKPH